MRITSLYFLGCAVTEFMHAVGAGSNTVFKLEKSRTTISPLSRLHVYFKDCQVEAGICHHDEALMATQTPEFPSHENEPHRFAWKCLASPSLAGVKSSSGKARKAYLLCAHGVSI